MIITLEAASYVITLILLLTLSGGGAFSVVFLQQQLQQASAFQYTCNSSIIGRACMHASRQSLLYNLIKRLSLYLFPERIRQNYLLDLLLSYVF